jgi:hypothetical protein
MGSVSSQMTMPDDNADENLNDKTTIQHQMASLDDNQDDNTR